MIVLISGLAPSQGEPDIALDGKPFTTILYANGPGYTLNLDPQAGECAHDREELDNKTVIGGLVVLKHHKRFIYLFYVT